MILDLKLKLVSEKLCYTFFITAKIEGGKFSFFYYRINFAIVLDCYITDFYVLCCLFIFLLVEYPTKSKDWELSVLKKERKYRQP